MRAASPALLAFLTSTTQLAVADLCTLTPIDSGGQPLAPIRLTDVDQAVTTPDGRTFQPAGSAAGPLFARDRVKLTVGTEVTAMQVTLTADPLVHTLQGVPWPAAVRAGVLDGARVMIETAFAADPAAPLVGTLIQFSGRVGQAVCGREVITLRVDSDLALLALPVPRTLYQAACVHQLYDSGCGVARSAYRDTGSAGAGSTAARIVASLPRAAGTYALGTCTFTGGANAGVTRTVHDWDGAALRFAYPFPTAPAAGDPFTVQAGCDKTQGTCSARFANLARFQGYPYIPPPDTVQGF